MDLRICLLNEADIIDFQEKQLEKLLNTLSRGMRSGWVPGEVIHTAVNMYVARRQILPGVYGLRVTETSKDAIMVIRPSTPLTVIGDIGWNHALCSTPAGERIVVHPFHVMKHVPGSYTSYRGGVRKVVRPEHFSDDENVVPISRLPELK